MSTITETETSHEDPGVREDAPEAPAPASTLRDDALGAFADEPDETAEEVEAPDRPVSDVDDVVKDVPEKSWRVHGMLKGRRRQGREVVDYEQEFDRTYIQKPLSYLGMLQFTGLIGRKLDEILSSGLSMGVVNEVMAFQEMIGRNEDGGLSLDLSQTDFSGIDSFVRGFAKIAAYVPDIIPEAQCIWLRVPPADQLAVMQIWSRPIDEGGLTMDEFEEMLDIFINQNYEELETFLLRRLKRLGRRVIKERRRLHPVADES